MNFNINNLFIYLFYHIYLFILTYLIINFIFYFSWSVPFQKKIFHLPINFRTILIYHIRLFIFCSYYYVELFRYWVDSLSGLGECHHTLISGRDNLLSPRFIGLICVQTLSSRTSVTYPWEATETIRKFPLVLSISIVRLVG